jgi:uncharacterized protein (TIGR00255 family)
MTSAGNRPRKRKKARIKSMTGFGKGAVKCPYGKMTVEVKTLNHKSMDIICNPFNGLFMLEQKMQKVFDKKIFRGKVFVRIAMEESPDQKKKLQKIEINEDIARESLRKIKKIQKKLGVRGEIQIRELIGLPGVMESTSDKKGEGLWPHIKKALESALVKLVAYREREGMRLARDFNARLRSIKKHMRGIKRYGEQSANEYRKKLVRSIRGISKNTEPDMGKLEAEVALFARNCDITEETIRLEGHIDEYKNAMNKTETDVGKKLDFIAQEMQREANTIGAKSNDFRTAKAVIEIKSEIEKIREQVKNVE